MNSKTRLLVCMLAILGLLMFALAFGAFAQEHPEHPKQEAQAQEHPEHPNNHAAEHPEHPQEHPKAAVTVTKEMMAEAITGYINKDTALKGGYFCVYDAQAKAPLALKLDKVHQDKLAKVSEGLYFACSDFQATDGKMYDLDFFMKPTDHGLEVSEVMIHKEAGKPRYGWVEENGVWKRK
jgi:hypothetical protein